MPRIRANNLSGHYDLTWSSILEAMETCLKEKSFSEMNFGEIGKRAGIARNTLYNYAKDKHALLDQAAELAAEDLLSEISGILSDEQTAPNQIESVITIVLNWVSTGPFRHIVLASLLYGADHNTHDNGHRITVQARMHAIASDILSKGRSDGHFSRASDLDVTLNLISGALNAAVHEVVRHPEKLTAVRSGTIAFILAGLKSS